LCGPDTSQTSQGPGSHSHHGACKRHAIQTWGSAHRSYFTSCLHPTKRPRISCTCRGCGDCERNPLLQITPIQYQHQSTPVNSGLSPHWERLAYAQAQRQSPVVTAANVAQRLLRKHTLTSVRAFLCPQDLVSPSARCSLPALVAECTLPHPRVATEHAANARIADGRPATAWD
jgi:hypothetical protein